MKVQTIKEKCRILPVLIIVGKSGLTGSVMDEIKSQLKDKKMIKVKFLKSAVEKKDKKALFKELADKTSSEIVQQVGFVLVLKKR